MSLIRCHCLLLGAATLIAGCTIINLGEVDDTPIGQSSIATTLDSLATTESADLIRDVGDGLLSRRELIPVLFPEFDTIVEAGADAVLPRNINLPASPKLLSEKTTLTLSHPLKGFDV